MSKASSYFKRNSLATFMAVFKEALLLSLKSMEVDRICGAISRGVGLIS
jgi:hypothetical protein